MPDPQETVVDDVESTSVDGGIDTSAEETESAAAVGAGAPTPEGTGDGSTESASEAQPSEAATRKLAPATTPQQPTDKSSKKPGASHGGAPAAKPAAAAPAAPDPAQAFNNERANWGRERQKLAADLEAQRTEVVKFQRAEQERRAEAERQQLKPWHPRHPDYSATRDRLGRVRAFEQAMAALPAELQADPQQRARIAQSLRVTQEDAKLSNEFDTSRENTIREFTESPDGFIAQIVAAEVPAMIQQAFNQFQAFNKARSDVERDWADPKALEPHAAWIKERLAAGDPYDSVKEGVTMRNRIAELEAQVKGVGAREAQATSKERAAAERQRLAKGNATITRDTKTTGRPDFYQQAVSWAKAENIKVGSDKFNRHLVRLEEAHRIQAATQDE